MCVWVGREGGRGFDVVVSVSSFALPFASYFPTSPLLLLLLLLHSEKCPKIIKQHKPPTYPSARSESGRFKLDVCTRYVVFGGCCLWLVSWLS